MYSGAGLETGGGIRRSPEVSELGGDIEKLFFQIFVDFVLPKINQKGLKAYVSRCLGFFKISCRSESSNYKPGRNSQVAWVWFL